MNQNLLHPKRGLLLAPEDGAGASSTATVPAGAGASQSAPPASSSGGSGVLAPPTEQTQGGAPLNQQGNAQPVSATDQPPTATPLTPEEFEERAYKASQRAMADARAAEEQRAREAEQKKAEQQREQQRRALGHVGAAEDALDALDIRQEMYEQALELHPDMPAESRQQLKNDLRNFKTLESLKAARDAKLHVKLADDAAGEAIRGGKYVPKNVVPPSREPIGNATGARPQATAIPAAYKQEVAELGLTEAELAEAYALDSERRGW